MLSTKSKPTQQYSLQFEALGTVWRIDSSQRIDDDLASQIRDGLERYDKTYSRFRDDSIVAEMAKHAGTFTFPADFKQLFQLYSTCYDATGGAMTPLIGKTLEQLGYDKTYSLTPGVVDGVPDLMKAVAWDGDATLATDMPVVFDIGAAGKGQAVDRIVAIMRRAGVESFTVDASGDIYHQGDSSEVIGLEHPFDASKVIGTVNITNQSLCASASNRRSWGEIHHIINANTGQPVRDVVATWVIADSAMVADGIATALFFVDSADSLAEHYDFSYVRLFMNGTVDYSDTFEGELFI